MVIRTTNDKTMEKVKISIEIETNSDQLQGVIEKVLQSLQKSSTCDKHSEVEVCAPLRSDIPRDDSGNGGWRQPIHTRF
jgi:hypothetical protein